VGSINPKLYTSCRQVTRKVGAERTKTKNKENVPASRMAAVQNFA